MKRSTWTIAVVALAAPLHFAFAGCGSETGGAPPAVDGGADGETLDAARSDCRVVGSACASSGECCTGNCDATSKVCAQSVSACGAPDAACTTNTECCTFSCVGGKCSNKQCVADGEGCAADGECCGGKCAATEGGASTCAPLNAACKTSGNPCAADGDCCSKSCAGGICSATPSFCTQNGDACANDVDCCGGLCTKAAGATLGLCGVANAPGAGNCAPAGQVCGQATTGGELPNCGGECCSRSCRPYAPTGAIVCQPPSGCRPTGELCQSDADCCGSPGMPGSTNVSGGKTSDVHCSKAPGATIGRCDNGKACEPAGAICRLATNSCNATDRCCSGTVQKHPLNCQQDSLGIPRCTAATDYDCEASGPPPAGTACASSADCCNRPCVPNPAGTPPFVCAAEACVPSGGACTTTADCCAGSPCDVPPGASKGTCGASGVGTDAGTPGGGTNCAQYGQQCTVAGDCCNGVPCTAGFCTFPGPK